MGFGGSLGKSFNKNTGVGALIGGGVGGLKDFFLGSKSQGSAEKFGELQPEQQQALGLYSEGLSGLKNFNPAEQARIAILNQERQARGGVADAERQAKDLVAQRGLSKSAAGISSILGVSRGLNERLQGIRAQQPLLQQQLEGDRINRLGQLTGGVNSIYNTRTYTPAVQGGVRQGGILQPLLGIGGAVAGGAYGGPQGAAAGYQVGTGVGGTLQNYQR